MDISTLVIAVVALAALAWLGFLFGTSVRRGASEEVPPNFRPYYTDADLESRRLDRTLVIALTVAVFLAISLPIYYMGEVRRQARAAESFEETAVERGLHIYEEEFQCINCHGPAGVGGSADFVEERSGIRVSWAAPALNDIFYRYEEDEIRYWIVFGRANTPMPAWGLEGGGPMNDQQVEEVTAYLQSIQLPQEEVLAQVERAIETERTRIENAEQIVQDLITQQEAQIAEIQRAPDLLEPAQALLTQLRATVQAGFEEGVDSDGDGVSDSAEVEITAIMQEAAELLAPLAPTGEETPEAGEEGTTTTTAPADATTTTTAPEGETTQTTVPAEEEPTAIQSDLAVSFDPDNPTSTLNDLGEPIPDREAVIDARSALQTEVTALQVTVDNLETRIQQAEHGLEFLQRSLEERRWEFDYEEIAASERFGGSAEDAERAALLFNAYCARCHTSGYSAGVAFQFQPGSGAMGPALWDQRALVQFPDPAAHLDFVLNGTENGVGYGVNGIGTGRMPGFGPVLPLEDLELIVEFERSL